MTLWKNQWLAAAIIVLILFLLVQSEVDVFNATIRGITNLLVFDFSGTGIVIALIIGLLLVYHFSTQKRAAAHT